MDIKTSDIVDVSGDGGFMHDEWVIINNESGKKYIVYKGNDKDIIPTIYRECNNKSMGEKDLKKLSNVNKLDEFISVMNTCK